MLRIKSISFFLAVAVVCAIGAECVEVDLDKFLVAITSGLEDACAKNNLEKFAQDLVNKVPEAVDCVSGHFRWHKGPEHSIVRYAGGVGASKDLCRDLIEAGAHSEDVQTKLRVGACKVWVDYNPRIVELFGDSSKFSLFNN